jgi:hypothetical protein
MAPNGGNVTITAVGATHTQQEYNSFYDGLGGFGWRRGWGGGGFGQTTTTVEQIPVGTLVIDMYDGSSKRLVWRGMSTDTLSSKPKKIPKCSTRPSTRCPKNSRPSEHNSLTLSRP